MQRERHRALRSDCGWGSGGLRHAADGRQVREGMGADSSERASRVPRGRPRARREGPRNGLGGGAVRHRRRKSGERERPDCRGPRMTPVGRWRHPISGLVVSGASPWRGGDAPRKAVVSSARPTPGRGTRGRGSRDAAVPPVPLAPLHHSIRESVTDQRANIASVGPKPRTARKRDVGQTDTELSSVRVVSRAPARGSKTSAGPTPPPRFTPREAPNMSAESPPPIGLCAGCCHARRVSTPRSRFWLCERSRDDASYDRYPRLPVLACPGFEPGEPLELGPPAADKAAEPQK